MFGQGRGIRDERGAVMPMVALMMTILLGITAIAIDIGHQRVERRDVQAVADMVALDMSRHLDGRTHAVIKAASDWKTGISQSVARNANMGQLPSVTVQQQQEVAEATVAGSPLRVDVVMGSVDENGVFTAGPYPDVPNAVRVTATSAVDYAFTPGGGTVARSAIATAEGGACFAIGSYAASLDTTTSPLLGDLLGLLGTGVSLDVADYNALAAADVDLAYFLGAKVGAVTLESVIDGDELVRLDDFYLATLEALRAQNAADPDPGTTAAISVLGRINALVGASQFKAADLLNLSTGGGSGLASSLNVFDLLTASAAAATKRKGLTLDKVGLNLGPLANVSTSLDLISPPTVGCGRKNDPNASAESSALAMELESALAAISIPGLVDTKVGLSGSTSLASAKGQLRDVKCGPESIKVGVSDGLLKVDLTLDLSTGIKLGLLGVDLYRVSGAIKITGTTSSTGDATVVLDSDDDYDRPVRVNNDSSGLPELHVNTESLTVKLLGLPVGLGKVLSPLTDALVAGLINPLVAGLDSVVLTPTLHSLGMDLSGADVFALRTPTCDNPRLVG